MVLKKTLKKGTEMMKFVKKIGILTSFLICFSSLFAFDFGGLLSNKTSFETYGKEFNFNQKNIFSLWARQNFNKSGENYFSTEVFYNFNANFDEKNYSNIVDFSLLKFAFEKNSNFGKFNFNVGRFYFSDLTDLIFTQNSDGVKVDFQNDYFKTSVYASYTGLLNSLSTEMITSPAGSFLNDENMLFVEKTSQTNSNDFYNFAEKYAICEVLFSLPNIFANQTVSVEYLSAFKLEKESFNRMYANLQFEGPIYQSFFYNLSTSFGFSNYKGENSFSILSKANLSYYLKNASFGLNAIYASGKNGFFSSFSGITKNVSTYSLQDFLYSGIIKTGLNATYKPISELLLFADCDAIFDATSSYIEYYAFQYSVGILWQLKSDFQLGLTGCQFFDKENSNLIKKTYFCLNASLAF